MEIRRATLDTCGDARGVVVAIDVIRAFTTAAFAFAAGARQILLTSTVEEALDLRQRFPGAKAMGEVGGLPIAGFDFSNSPTEIAGQDLTGLRLVQRTTAGTQGIVRSGQAQALLAASFVVAAATARRLRKLAPLPVTFVLTGALPDGRGDEDAACADYIEALLRGGSPDPAPYVQRVRNSLNAGLFTDPEKQGMPPSDLDYVTQVDRFDFAMQVRREDGLFIMEPV